jgi:hypothetical protein
MSTWPSTDGRKTMTSRAQLIAWRIVLRLAAIPVLSERLDGSVLDQARAVVACELEHAFRAGGYPPEE